MILTEKEITLQWIKTAKDMYGTRVFKPDFANGLLILGQYELSDENNLEALREDLDNIRRLSHAKVGEKITSVCGMYGWVRLENQGTDHDNDDADCWYGSHPGCRVLQCNECDHVWSTCGDLPACPNGDCCSEDFEVIMTIEK